MLNNSVSPVDLYTNTDEFLKGALEGEAKNLDILGNTLHTIALSRQGFWSSSAPDSDVIVFIAFFSTKDKLLFYVETSDNKHYVRKIDNDEYTEYIFTPSVFDLDSGRLSLPSDVIRRK
jgi:hypothetical protein